MALVCLFFLSPYHKVSLNPSLVRVTLSLLCPHAGSSEKCPSDHCHSLVLLFSEISEAEQCVCGKRRLRSQEMSIT